MGSAWDLANQKLVSNYWWIIIVSVRASYLKCSSAALIQVRRPVLIIEIKKPSNTKVSHRLIDC